MDGICSMSTTTATPTACLPLNPPATKLIPTLTHLVGISLILYRSSQQVKSQTTLARYLPPTSPTPEMQSTAETTPNPPAVVADGIFEDLATPMSFGLFDDFNYTTRKATTKIWIRIIIHNDVDLIDIQWEWLTPRLLKIRVVWPEWFQNAEQMAAFTVDEGVPFFPSSQPLTLVEEDNHGDGHLTFDRDMNVDIEPEIELLDVDVASKATKVNLLQILVE